MSGADFITYARLRSTMTPLEQAWALLKADPESQAWSREYGTGYSAFLHPDAPGSLSPLINNEGTIDPNVMSMRSRVFPSQYGNTEVSGPADPQERGFGAGYFDRGDLGIMADSQGFTALSPEGGISRVDRPHAYEEAPPVGSPQHDIDTMGLTIGAKSALGIPLSTAEHEYFLRYFGRS